MEDELRSLVAAGGLGAYHPFADSARLLSWWDGQNNFERLRYARNQVVHGSYSFAGGRFTVASDTGTVWLDLSEQDTLEFASAVVALNRRA